MEEKIIAKKKSKPKKWGDKGFVGKVQFGCYEYKIRFVSEEEMQKMFQPLLPGQKAYGGAFCDEQDIVISSSLTEQTKKLTVMHEITHIVFLNNNIGRNGNQVNIEDETFVDNTGARYYEIIKRNPELMRWLLK